MKVLILKKVTGWNYISVGVVKHMFIVFNIRNGGKKDDVLLALLFNFAVENAFTTFEFKWDDWH
jgi:hypothetical protein